MNRFQAVIEKAGGQEVWLKAPRRGEAPPSLEADVPRDVVAASAVFDRVRGAIQREASRQGLVEIESRVPRADGGQTVEIRLERRHERVGGWRLREVRELRRAAIVIDDLGADLSPARELFALPFPLTFSVLPQLRHSVEIAQQAHRSGHEVMLHLPMQPELGSAAAAGPGAIQLGLSSQAVAAIIERDLESVPYCAGVSNHMGSRATVDATLMAEVMTVLAEHHFYFVDSRTTAATVALDAARRQGLPAFYRSVFLDDTRTVDYSLGQLRAFRRVVEQQGAALAIGHPYPTTFSALVQFFPEFDQDDIQLVSASELVRLPEVARLSPPRRTP